VYLYDPLFRRFYYDVPGSIIDPSEFSFAQGIIPLHTPGLSPMVRLAQPGHIEIPRTRGQIVTDPDAEIDFCSMCSCLDSSRCDECPI
jgi:hypothetical protein